MRDKTKITSEHVKRLLDEKYHAAHKHMIAFEVADGTGGASSRRADAVSLEFWPSNGLELIGYEIKVSRADWLGELRQPEKSHAVGRFCDRFYLVAPNGVLKPGELPPTWGYMQVTEKAIRAKIKAPIRHTENPDKAFVASLLRSMLEKYQDTDFLQEKYNVFREDAKKEASESFEREIKRLRAENEVNKTLIKDFNQKTGVDLNEYSIGKICDVVNMINTSKRLDFEIAQQSNQMQRLSEHLKVMKNSLDLLEAIRRRAK